MGRITGAHQAQLLSLEHQVAAGACITALAPPLPHQLQCVQGMAQAGPATVLHGLQPLALQQLHMYRVLEATPWWCPMQKLQTRSWLTPS